MRLVGFLKRRHFLGAEGDVNGGKALLEMMELGGADDRGGDARRLQNPGAGDLGGRDAALAGHFLHRGGNLEIVVAEIHLLGKIVGLRPSGCRPLIFTLAVAGEKSPRQRAPRNDPHPLIQAQRNHLPFFLAIDQVVMVLHGHETVPAVLARHVQRLGKLPRRHAAGAQVAHLAGTHQGVECVEGFFNRGGRVPAVNLVQVDVIHVEPPQRVFARLDDVLAAQAAAVGSRRHGAVDLGGHHDVVALRHLAQPVARDGLAQAHRVHVGGVEKGDAGLQCRGEVLAGVFLAQGPVAGPRPVGLLAAAVTHTSKADS